MDHVLTPVPLSWSSTASQSTMTARTWIKSTSRTPSHCDSLCSRPKWAATDAERTAASQTWVRETVSCEGWIFYARFKKVTQVPEVTEVTATGCWELPPPTLAILFSLLFNSAYTSMLWSEFMLGSCIAANIGFGLQLLNVSYSTNESSHQINHSFFWINQQLYISLRK